MPPPMSPQRGFTLVEAIMAITITGILTAIIASFMARPIQGYVAAARRADLTDSADLALRRMALELRAAVPNTVRVVNGYVEFIPAKSVGRYCTDTDSCTNRMTDFDSTRAAAAHNFSFDVRGALPTATAGDRLIIFNTGQSGLNAYNDNNCATVTTLAGATLSYNGRAFPYSSPNKYFFIAPASGPVRFNCTSTQVQRIAGSTSFCGITPTASTAVLAGADTVSCAFTYDSVSASNSLLSVQISLTQAGETVTLMHQIHVDNQP